MERFIGLGERQRTGIDFSDPKLLPIFGRAERALVFNCVVDTTGNEIFFVIRNSAVTCASNDSTSREGAGS